VAPPTRQRGHPPIGERLRAERHARGLSLRDLAEKLGVSPSLISQIETGRARPSVNTLYAIANELSVSIDELLFLDADRADSALEDGPSGPQNGSPASVGAVQRAHDRKKIRLASGVLWERLTTSSDPGTEFLFVTYEVGGASSPSNEYQRHNGREWGYVLGGRLGITVAFDDYELGPGDSVQLDSTIPHRLYNRGTTPVRAIWFVAGRTSLERVAPVHWDESAQESSRPQPND
jgi:transcriptional regulator with XRE-family HTH domain